jgi:predicted heme/steroid binding protein
MKKFNSDELSLFDGKKDHPIYIGYMGKVYDVTKSDLWNKGFHMNRHHAGRDLTTDIQAAPHGLEVLERYPQVGILQKDNHLQREIPKSVSPEIKPPIRFL